MSELSYLEKLLDGVEVEWLPLAKVCRLINGRAYKQEELLSKGKYPVLRVGNFFTNQNWYYSDLELDQDKYCDNGDLLYAWSASFGPRIWHGGKSIYHYHIWKVVPDSNLICKQFLYYLLQWDTKALKDAHSTGSTMMHISKTTIEKRLVPIPCPDNPEKSLAIQSEIVRILDKFTALTAELTAELNMRKKQYNYYRDQLLSFDDEQEKPIYLEKLLDGVEVEWLPLGEVSALRRGRVMSKGYLTDNFGPYPVYSSQTANNGKIGSINTFDFDGEYISWTTDGANAGTVFYRTGKFSITNVCGLITLKSKYPLIYKFLFYWLTIEAKKHVYSGMGNPKLMSHQVENIPVPVPCPDNPEKSLAIQSEIVRILDKFDTLTNSITEGLPREIELRQKQYEYYRDLLFSFPKPEAVSN
ncbi:TPA: restriction endonuclease subunit S [Escherichia coli]|uniref:restriction endonuclease subunit S n=1 Tax=Escherichia coli TaxID=562 RepID=UPI0016A0102A|nr:restriction endonuclease subunit S [Escherichia coli]EFP6182684.1 restriction endonuclease subunit S [Salmonella enterica]EFJ2136533.1 restriction endonuclease subunit S [Escherichia coli]EJS5405918.1 restriction endonuclease subunit S [Salmonella enterica]EJU0565560.1 restriction endonuclease subunit S [Salmonella enterica]EJV5252675.1 restriction endonuclease subunit S [Salmonella enterica]